MDQMEDSEERSLQSNIYMKKSRNFIPTISIAEACLKTLQSQAYLRGVLSTFKRTLVSALD